MIRTKQRFKTVSTLAYAIVIFIILEQLLDCIAINCRCFFFWYRIFQYHQNMYHKIKYFSTTAVKILFYYHIIKCD